MARQDANSLQIGTFGGLSIARGGASIDTFASRKAEALLVYLACNPRPHPREVLAELLWDDRSQRQAMANLRVVLSSLRKEVGSHVEITRTSASITNDAALRLDVADLEAAATRLRQQDGPLSSGLAEEMTAALAGYQGDFLEGFFIPDAGGFEAWATAERERLHRLATGALQNLGRWYLQQAKHAEAIATSSRLLELDPLAEVGYRQLMEALARNGQRSRALATYEALVETLQSELGLDPARVTLALVEAIRSETLEPVVDSPTAGTRRYQLPAPATPLIGREAELDDLGTRLLDDRTRLLSIVAPGGMGKTRLALEVARNLTQSFADEAAFVPLAPLDSSKMFVPAVAEALRFDLGPEPERQLLDYLSAKELLLVLDNLEHLLDVTPLLTEIVRTAPAVTLLVTSRERLKLQVERVYPLHGLELSNWESLAEAQDDPAVRLFLHHAQRVRPSFSLRPEHLPSLREIFRLTGGMPLAVILAAGWVAVLSPADIAGEIGRSLDLLETTERDLPVRHRSMRAVFNMTWQRLGEREQARFAALSVFRGGFTREAARAVAGATPRDLLSLVDRSLLWRVDGGRFEVHELLRQFAAEKLAGLPDEREAVRERHSRYYCRFLEKREPELKGPRNLEAEAEIGADIANLHAGWKWAAANSPELVYQAQTALQLFFKRQGRLIESFSAFQQAQAWLEKRESVDARRMARLFLWGSSVSRHRSLELYDALFRRAIGYMEEAALQGEDVRAERAAILAQMGRYSSTEREGLAWLTESVSLFQALGLRWDLAMAHQLLGRKYSEYCRFNQAHKHLSHALALFERKGDHKLALWPRIRLARNAAFMGGLTEAEMALRDALTRAEAIGDDFASATALYFLGEVLNFSGRFEEALAVLETSRARHVGMRPIEAAESKVEQSISALYLGHYAKVRLEAQVYFDRAQDPATATYCEPMYHRLRGQVALALARTGEARVHLQDSLSGWPAPDVPCWHAAYGAALLGYAALFDGNLDEAKQHLTRALALRLFTPVLVALPAAALLLAEMGDRGRAVALYALAGRHGLVANSQWFEDVAGRRMATVAAVLPAEDVAAARAWGAERNLWETVDELLQELNGMAV